LHFCADNIENMMKPKLYNSDIPRELSVMTELIVDVYNYFDNLSWSNSSFEEIGFYEKDKKTKSQIFFGIWYEAWEHFGCPLCLTVLDKSHAPIEKYVSLQKRINEKQMGGLRVSIDFQGYAIIIFDHDFLNWENDAERIADLFEEISISFGING